MSIWPALAASASATSATARDDALWLLVSAGLALLSIPGLVLVYAGPLRARERARVAVAALSGAALVVLIWLEVGYGAVYGPAWLPHVLGDPLSATGFQQLTLDPAAIDMRTLAFAAFQTVFPLIAVTILATGAASRMRTTGWLVTVAVWTLAVLLPVEHAVFDLRDGWAARIGVNDFAGGIAVSATAGAACLALALTVGRRRADPGGIAAPARTGRPRAALTTVLGAALVLVGWLALTGGAEAAVDGVATLCWVDTLAGAAGGVLASMVVAAIVGRLSRWSAATTGVVAGVSAVSAGCNVLTPTWSLVIGAVAGAVCGLLLQLPAVRAAGGTADAAMVHLPAAIVSAVFVGVFALGIGFVQTGSPEQFLVQLGATLGAAGYSFAVAWVTGTVYVRASRDRRSHRPPSGATKGVR